MFRYVRWSRAAVLALSVFAASAGEAQAPVAPPILTLDAALRQAIEQAPLLAQARANTDAERGRLAQARRWPNPEASLQAENFAGSRELSGFDGAEVTAQLEQPLEVGGKRSARIAAGRAGVEIAELRAAVARLDLEQAVRRAYAETAAAQERGVLAREEARTNEEIASAVAKLVAAGREPPLREARSRVERTTAQAAALAADRDYLNARRRLAALSGQTDTQFAVAPEVLANSAAGPAVASAEVKNPIDIEVVEKEVQRARAQVRVERAARIPDPRVTAGVRRLEADNATALVAGVAFPLPVFNANGGAIAAAAADVRRAEAAVKQAEVDTQVRASSARSSLETATAQAAAFASAAIPAAEEAVRVARLGYAAGKFSYLELLEASRALAQARRQRIDAQLEVARAAADLDRALGRSMIPE